MREEAKERGARVSGTSFSSGRITFLLFLCALLFYLPLGRGHFSGTDEVAQFEMARAMQERAALDIGPLMHTEVGRGGLRYSFFAVGQAIFTLPFLAVADLAEALLPHAWMLAISGPEMRDARHVYGGDLAHSVTMLYPAVVAALLVLLFFRFELALGVRLRTALGVSLLFGATTYAVVMSTYYLRHSTVACLMLGAFLCFFRWREQGNTRDLLVGASLACAIPLVRVPAAVLALGFAAQLGQAIFRRSHGLRDLGVALRAVLLALAPLAVALLLHMAFNYAKWGAWLESPMLGQRAELSNPLWVGVRGYLFSPGASIFVYSPLLLLAPFALPVFWRKWPAECAAFLLVALACLLLHSKFDRWTGLWSAPGPRYLFLAVPLLLLPLGPWVDAGSQRLKWLAIAPLALVGLCVQAVMTLVAWTQVPRLAGYPKEPDYSDFLFQVDQSPVVVMARLLAEGGPLDPWLFQLARGWPAVPASPGLALALFFGWALTLTACALLLRRELARAS